MYRDALVKNPMVVGRRGLAVSGGINGATASVEVRGCRQSSGDSLTEGMSVFLVGARSFLEEIRNSF